MLAQEGLLTFNTSETLTLPKLWGLLVSWADKIPRTDTHDNPPTRTPASKLCNYVLSRAFPPVLSSSIASHKGKKFLENRTVKETTYCQRRK